MTYCCPKCFSDPYLETSVFPENHLIKGTCSYCGSSDQYLLEPYALRDLFEFLLGIYKADSSGKLLPEVLKEDWNMFANPVMDVSKCKDLLGEIFDDGNIGRSSYSPSEESWTGSLEDWEEFRNELKHENRFFPKNSIQFERLQELLSYLIISPDVVGKSWFRSRIQEGEEKFSIEQMGAPPKEKASPGRANPPGIPYLYLSSDEKTAISEVRPHTGEFSSVANFFINDELVFVDLRDPRSTVSPFVFPDESQLASLRGDIDFLEHLGYELSRPVLPRTANVDYIPSQYLCEFIKNSDFHGVIYGSSLESGMNCALFYPDLAFPGEVVRRKISRVSVEVE